MLSFRVSVRFFYQSWQESVAMTVQKHTKNNYSLTYCIFKFTLLRHFVIYLLKNTIIDSTQLLRQTCLHYDPTVAMVNHICGLICALIALDNCT